MEIADLHAPLKTKRCKKRRVPWMSAEIKELMRQRDQMHRIAVTTKNEQFLQLYKCMRNNVTCKLRRVKKEYLYHLFTNESSTPQAFWKNVKRVLPGSSCKMPPALNVNNQLCSDPTTIADAFNEYLINIGPSLNQQSQSASPASLVTEDAVISLPSDKSFNLSVVSVDVVYHHLKSVSTKKTAGFDNLPAYLIKEAAPVIAPVITSIINSSLRSGKVPVQWKRARVTPVFKGGDKTQMNNYRPISTLPILSKVLERVVYNQLSQHLESNNLLPPQQSGFRPAFSTTSLLLKITTNWMKSIDSGCYVGALFLDLRKAFDTVNHTILLNKLSDVGVQTTSLRWFENYLEDRTQSVRLEDKISTPGVITCGVPQGSILGPLLFSVYVRDLPDQACLCEVDQFADDTSMHTTSRSLDEIEYRLNNDLERIANWLKRQKLHLNTVKSHVILFGSGPALSRSPILHVALQGHRIEQVKSVKYLGMILDSHLSWNDHVRQLRNKTNKTVRMLKRLSYIVPSDTVKKLYCGVVLPVLDYCDVVWSGCSKTASDELEVVHNNAARAVLGAPHRTSATLLRDRLGWSTLTQRRICHTAIWTYRCLKGYAPPYLGDLFVPTSKIHQRHTRQSNGLYIPRPKTNYLKRSFVYQGTLTWNSLPESMRIVSSLDAFKRSCKYHFLHP